MRFTSQLAILSLALLPGAAAAQVADSLTAQYQQLATAAWLHLEDKAALLPLMTGLGPEQAQRLGAQLSRRGLARLGNETLEERATVRLRMLDAADERACAAWARGTATPADVIPIIMHADSTDRAAWMRMSMEAMLAEARGQPERASASPDDVALTLEVVADELPEGDAERVWAILGDVGQASDADVCWFDRTVYRTVLGFEPDARRVALRTLIALESGD